MSGRWELEHRAGGRPERSGEGGGNANEYGGGRLGALNELSGDSRGSTVTDYNGPTRFGVEPAGSEAWRARLWRYRGFTIAILRVTLRCSVNTNDADSAAHPALIVLWRGVEQSGSSLGS